MEIIALVLSILACWILIGIAGGVLLEAGLREPGELAEDSGRYYVGIVLGPLWLLVGLNAYLEYR